QPLSTKGGLYGSCLSLRARRRPQSPSERRSCAPPLRYPPYSVLVALIGRGGEVVSRRVSAYRRNALTGLVTLRGPANPIASGSGGPRHATSPCALYRCRPRTPGRVIGVRLQLITVSRRAAAAPRGIRTAAAAAAARGERDRVPD